MNTYRFTGKYNPFEINKIFFDERNGHRKLIPESFNKNNVFWLIVLSLFFLFRCMAAAFFRLRKKSFDSLYNNKLLFILPTVNNQKTLQNLIAAVKKEKNNVVVAGECYYSRFHVAAVSLVYLPMLLKEFQKLTVEDKRVALYYLHDIVLTPGLTSFYLRVLKKYRPEGVVMANDHLFLTKTLELVCEDFGIKTIYVQHASVSYAFPELHFSYSFLDGKDSLLKYKAEGKKCSGDIIMLGAARYDSLGSYRINSFYVS